MNDPEQLKAELSRIFHEVTSKGLTAVSFEDEMEPLIDEFYNDVYEEGFSDGYDNCDGNKEDMTDYGPSEVPEY
jgi:hypothetical protein